ncbi:serine/threonine-protein kinase [Tardiphaga robiniae]|uniref:serine/threonine-protein kinase n=1 Tax=Tardiphaga robiniae TaxID=943830 RepID=UPI0015864287|nr:serine/threonine-protein kinase [Tardiphaga robiniae]NUU41844.1 serine/threonine protein kinase [Tardiphaga robiniae]
MKVAKLADEWFIGPQIGAGGFGKVFEARNASGLQAVVKLVPKSPGAARELLFVNLDGARRIVPIIDQGEIDGAWALVMPRATESLRDRMERSASLSLADAIEIVSQIAAALGEIEGRIVHRDLKPENILFLDGQWCLADFGISRYAEATTAPDTQKYAMTAPYAAPERWRGERASSACDIYALGVIAFELLTGNRPFTGPSFEDFREQHLHVDAPAIQVGSTAIRALVAEMLFKAPGARPSAKNMSARLERARQRKSGGLAKLSDVHLSEVAKKSEAERLASAARSAEDIRKELFAAGAALMKTHQQELVDAIRDAAPSAIEGANGKRSGRTIDLSTAQLELAPVRETPTDPWSWQPPSFKVIAQSAIILRVPRDRYDFEGRSHSLWYCDAFKEGVFEWVETAFMVSPLSSRSTTMRPFMADPGIEAAKALWNGMAEFQLAWPLERLDPDAFIDRWANWLGDAAQGRLHAPSTMPEKPTPRNWR